MRFSARKAAAWALILLGSTGCADDGATGDELDDGSEVTSFDAGAVASDASLIPSGSDASAVSALDAAGASGGDTTRDAGRPARNDAGSGGSNQTDAGQTDGGRAADATDAGAGRDAAIRDAGTSTDASTGTCPQRGSVSYTLQQKSAPTSAETMAYAKIREAMDKAIEKYNCYTSLAREVHITYDPGVATADGSTNGSIRFGSDASMHFVTAMHELGHVFGVGANQFKPLVQNGVFTGKIATDEVRRISGDAAATVKSDGTHFWPYGLNYVSEYKSEADLVGHCAIVVAIRKDLGL